MEWSGVRWDAVGCGAVGWGGVGCGHGRTINIARRRDTGCALFLFRLVPGLSLLEVARGDVPAHCALACVYRHPKKGLNPFLYYYLEARVGKIAATLRTPNLQYVFLESRGRS